MKELEKHYKKQLLPAPPETQPKIGQAQPETVQEIIAKMPNPPTVPPIISQEKRTP